MVEALLRVLDLGGVLPYSFKTTRFTFIESFVQQDNLLRKVLGEG